VKANQERTENVGITRRDFRARVNFVHRLRS
jgi:hypothetical protein